MRTVDANTPHLHQPQPPTLTKFNIRPTLKLNTPTNGLSHTRHGTASCTLSMATEKKKSRRQRQTAEKWRQHTPHIHDLRVAFLNVRGFGDACFRGYLLAQYRRRYDVLVLVETLCPGPGEERAWAKDWPNSGGTFWASGPPSKHTTPAPHQQPAPVAHPQAKTKTFTPTSTREGVSRFYSLETSRLRSQTP